MILFLHGFASSGNATKAEVLKEYCINNLGNQEFISPDLPVEPEKAIKLISNILKSADNNTIVFGSSLGGYYAMWAGTKHNTNIVLVNPAVEPYIDLKSVLGMNKNYQTGEEFEFKEEYLKQLKNLSSDIDFSRYPGEKIVLMLAEDDDLLDYRRTLKYFGNDYCKLILEKEAGHSFTKFGDNLKSVFDYFNIA
ncbi:MAG: YqiA/YcfP family alpha/beta fold hydrolase [Ignavibacteriota bacterium]